MNDEELTKLAEQELLREAERAAVRADAIGPEGWRKCPSRNINKRFLVSTIRDAVYTNKRVKPYTRKNIYYREKPTQNNSSDTSSSTSTNKNQLCDVEKQTNDVEENEKNEDDT